MTCELRNTTYKHKEMREWLSWWSATLPRSRPRVRVPSRAFLMPWIFQGFFCISERIPPELPFYIKNSGPWMTDSSGCLHSNQSETAIQRWHHGDLRKTLVRKSDLTAQLPLFSQVFLYQKVPTSNRTLCYAESPSDSLFFSISHYQCRIPNFVRLHGESGQTLLNLLIFQSTE